MWVSTHHQFSYFPSCMSCPRPPGHHRHKHAFLCEHLYVYGAGHLRVAYDCAGEFCLQASTATKIPMACVARAHSATCARVDLVEGSVLQNITPCDTSSARHVRGRRSPGRQILRYQRGCGIWFERVGVASARVLEFILYRPEVSHAKCRRQHPGTQ